MMINMTLHQPCHHCGRDVQIDAQPPLMPGRSATLLFTCTNVECPACLATFDSRSYSREEVERYVARKPVQR